MARGTYNGVEYAEYMEPADGYICKVWLPLLSNWVYVTESGERTLNVLEQIERQRESRDIVERGARQGSIPCHSIGI